MIKKTIAFALILAMALPFAACSSANEYGLSFTPDGSDKINYIFYNEERVVYVVGGLMMATVNDQPKMLEMALDSGDISIEAVIESAKEDYENGDIEGTIYPDGSCEYHFDGFNMIVLNTHLRNIDVYFTPSSMGYFDVYIK